MQQRKMAYTHIITRILVHCSTNSTCNSGEITTECTSIVTSINSEPLSSDSFDCPRKRRVDRPELTAKNLNPSLVSPHNSWTLSPSITGLPHSIPRVFCNWSANLSRRDTSKETPSAFTTYWRIGSCSMRQIWWNTRYSLTISNDIANIKFFCIVWYGCGTKHRMQHPSKTCNKPPFPLSLNLFNTPLSMLIQMEDNNPQSTHMRPLDSTSPYSTWPNKTLVPLFAMRMLCNPRGYSL